MPLSTGSIDSGFFGCTTDDSSKKGEDLLKMAPLSMTDEEETLSTSSSGFSQNSAPVGDSSSSSGPPSIYFSMSSGLSPRKHRTRVRRSNRKLKRPPRQISPRSDSPPSHSDSPSAGTSSCCLSVAGSSSSSVSSPTTSVRTSIDELALRLYFYFKSLLLAINRQKSICENIAYLVKDFDARWGNSGVRKKPCDPKGCLAPIYSSDRNGKLVHPAKFPLCWAVPQPAIFYQLMAIDVLEYIKFLEGVSPQVKTKQHPSGPPIHNEREASLSMEALKALQYQQQQHWQQQLARGAVFPFHPLVAINFENQMRSMKNRDQMYQHHVSLQKLPSSDGGESPAGKRDSSFDSQSSSEADPDALPSIMSKLDDDVSGADLDKTPSTEKKDNSRRSRKSDTKKQNEGDKSPAGWFQGQKCYGMG